MSAFPSFSRQAAQLSDVLQGEVVLPRQRGFEEARQAFNLAADQEPAAVIFAEAAQDVVAAVTLAAEHGRRVAPLRCRPATPTTGCGRSRPVSIHMT